ncbi:tetratricopeptide repeat protein [Flavobacterium granuli]|uniref:Tetratricopeptide (TPR) repeat protein n=1 Tax=Flavobacterium granuli TaxID=280093 RepID=A0ABU1RYZ8_9FLAO|nr:tetratricopeptide repeat protein [Flavobacterium granuli]MDR6843988.1 tetratricopeptide (TPR) repeat protein [Flavobacterium granuli]
MNVSSYNYLLNQPEEINEIQTVALEKVLDEFPFFQSARALRLKGLYNQSSYKYNFALKIAAAHTTDRSVLFDFITSESFIAIQKKTYERKIQELLNITVIDSQIIEKEEIAPIAATPLEHSILTSIKEANTNTAQNNSLFIDKLEIDKNVEQSILDSIKEATPTKTGEETIEAEKNLEIGKPLDFSKSETHSFHQWLQISRIQPIIRENLQENNSMAKEPESIIDESKKKKAELIDKFIETSPKIPPIKPGVVFTPNLDLNKEDNSYLMTETLAKVYLEQKKYQKAIQAYEILILKYPEKSSFFADRIKDIKIVQQNNN